MASSFSSGQSAQLAAAAAILFEDLGAGSKACRALYLSASAPAACPRGCTARAGKGNVSSYEGSGASDGSFCFFQAPSTTMAAAIDAGATAVEVASTAGFTPGDNVAISEEVNTIAALASIILENPVAANYPTGTVVRNLKEATSIQRVAADATFLAEVAAAAAREAGGSEEAVADAAGAAAAQADANAGLPAPAATANSSEILPVSSSTGSPATGGPDATTAATGQEGTDSIVNETASEAVDEPFASDRADNATEDDEALEPSVQEAAELDTPDPTLLVGCALAILAVCTVLAACIRLLLRHRRAGRRGGLDEAAAVGMVDTRGREADSWCAPPVGDSDNNDKVLPVLPGECSYDDCSGLETKVADSAELRNVLDDVYSDVEAGVPDWSSGGSEPEPEEPLADEPSAAQFTRQIPVHSGESGDGVTFGSQGTSGSNSLESFALEPATGSKGVAQVAAEASIAICDKVPDASTSSVAITPRRKCRGGSLWSDAKLEPWTVTITANMPNRAKTAPTSPQASCSTIPWPAQGSAVDSFAEATAEPKRMSQVVTTGAASFRQLSGSTWPLSGRPKSEGAPRVVGARRTKIAPSGQPWRPSTAPLPEGDVLDESLVGSKSLEGKRSLEATTHVMPISRQCSSSDSADSTLNVRRPASVLSQNSLVLGNAEEQRFSSQVSIESLPGAVLSADDNTVAASLTDGSDIGANVFMRSAHAQHTAGQAGHTRSQSLLGSVEPDMAAKRVTGSWCDDAASGNGSHTEDGTEHVQAIMEHTRSAPLRPQTVLSEPEADPSVKELSKAELVDSQRLSLPSGLSEVERRNAVPPPSTQQSQGRCPSCAQATAKWQACCHCGYAAGVRWDWNDGPSRFSARFYTQGSGLQRAVSADSAVAATLVPVASSACPRKAADGSSGAQAVGLPVVREDAVEIARRSWDKGAVERSLDEALERTITQSSWSILSDQSHMPSL
eukprot:TRINITY_DN40787_c0_g1_i1.p1 TRINITY_DN40787_c0_g1~~TRINITY_DN40787_c0_g1_i1.p1  ORF type:complete len:1064 (+),score=203.43 TRINITY_DN40787_c0_g1_i1:309-3194(+)